MGKAATEKAAAEKAATVARAAAEKDAAIKAANAEAARLAAAKNEAAEAAAIKKAEDELKEQLRMEQVNAELEAAHQKKQKEAQDKFEAAKAALEADGAEFVSQEEFARLKANKKSGCWSGLNLVVFLRLCYFYSDCYSSHTPKCPLPKVFGLITKNQQADFQVRFDCCQFVMQYCHTGLDNKIDSSPVLKVLCR